MQISSSNTLPILTGSRPQASPRPPASVRRSTETADTATNLVNYTDHEQAQRRSPLYVQPIQTGKLSRTGEQAMRAYRDAAMAGNPAELVNRVNVVA